MTNPQRPFLLNAQISLEARRIAHEHTDTCKGDGDSNVKHTKNCNNLHGEIVALAMQIKLARFQPPLQRRDELTPEPLFGVV